jgi:hypothetical protein
MIREIEFVGGPLDGRPSIDIGARCLHHISGGVRWIYLRTTDHTVGLDGVTRTIWRLTVHAPAGVTVHPALDPGGPS